MRDSFFPAIALTFTLKRLPICAFLLTLILPSYMPAQQEVFHLEFERVSANESKVWVIPPGLPEDPLPNGAQSWTLSIEHVGGGVITGATTAGTAGDLNLFPPGLRVPQDSFEVTQLGVCPSGNDGIVSAVILSFTNPITLDPVIPYVVLRIMYDPGEECELVFADSCEGSSQQPVQNSFTVEAISWPIFGLSGSCEPLGACCFEDEECADLTAEQCDDQGGVYQGDDVPCDEAECPQPTGACCLDDGTCADLTAEQCDDQGGVYQGDDVPCDPNPCALTVPVDIKPRSCPNPLNVKERGVVPVAILGTEHFDVTQVAAETVQLEGVSPFRWALEHAASPFYPIAGKEDCIEDCNEEDPDEHLDLTLKFGAQDLIAALGDVEDGECRRMQLTGDLQPEFGGTAILGEDVVIILQRGRGRGGDLTSVVDLLANTFIRGDSNADGFVDLSDSLFTFRSLFRGGPTPSCLKAADANDDGEINVSDGVYSLSFLFRGAPRFLRAPSSGCAWDPTEDALSCDSVEICNGP